jgi:thioredoxin reductase
MATIVIVGDGPGGLSAALFLAKAGHSVSVFGTDETAMHYAYLYNYLGIPEISGSDFQEIARRQITRFGAELVAEKVVSITRQEGGFLITSEGGSNTVADYLVLTEGKNSGLARALNVELTGDGVAVDREFRSSIDRVYVVGRSARPKRSQAIISAGAGATAALDILSREAGQDVQDWDSPPKDG